MMESPPFRLGDRLWANAAGLEEAPPCGFFPRRWFAALALQRGVEPASARGGNGPTGAALLLLGGSTGGGPHRNDVWRLSLPDRPRPGARPRWALVSAQDEGVLDVHGRQRTRRKWRGRQDFGCCAEAGDAGRSLVYVAAGAGTGSLCRDVWASEDEGASWVCMCAAAPWEQRRAPAFGAVPNRRGVLLLAGGMGICAEVYGDAWVSNDAGYTWTELEKPPWAANTGRYRAALLPLPGTSGGEVLLLGGCFVDGQDHGGDANIFGAGAGRVAGCCGGGTIGIERLMHDAWECQLDLEAVGRPQTARWSPWGGDHEQRGAASARQGVESATVTLDPSAPELVARLPERAFVGVAAAQCPIGGAIEWTAAEFAAPEVEATTATFRSTDPWKAGGRLTYVRFSDAPGSTGLPRLFLATCSGVWFTGDGEWSRQLRFALLVGVRLERLFGLPSATWRDWVLPAVLPPGHFSASGAASGASGRWRKSAALGTHLWPRWRVVGGSDRGGIVVRLGREFGSPKLSERLSCGAIIAQAEVAGERLQYTLLQGPGPDTGWVSISLQGRDLLVRCED